MFHCTQNSSLHVSGWHAVNRVCKDAHVAKPEMLTATKMRHRVSTLYAALDVPVQEHQFFYKHMGQTEAINENIYQAPLAEALILKVGVHLKNMDGHALQMQSNFQYVPPSDHCSADASLHLPDPEGSPVQSTSSCGQSAQLHQPFPYVTAGTTEDSDSSLTHAKTRKEPATLLDMKLFFTKQFSCNTNMSYFSLDLNWL